MILALLLACNTEKPPSEEIETTEAIDTSTEEVVVESCSVSEETQTGTSGLNRHGIRRRQSS